MALLAWGLTLYSASKPRMGIAPLAYMAFVFWLALLLGIWDSDLLLVAAVGSIPGLLGTYLLLAALTNSSKRKT